MNTRYSVSTVTLAIATLVVACGSDPDSMFGDSNGGAAANQAGNAGDLGGATGETSSHANTEACVTSVADGDVLPVHLVIMYDKSGSMREESRWSSCGSAMTSFFAAPATAGMEASLSFFSYNDSCDVDLYATPAVAMRKLPDATSFKLAIDAEAPSGKTPTLPAIQGAIKYAKSVEASLAGAGRVAIVLVTDGIPHGCGSTPENVGAEAATVAATIPTYVIGVGSELENLDTIAQGGGTQKGIIVSSGNPAQTTTDLTNALGAVKSALGCEYTVPAPPAGQTLDFSAVNVVFTPNGALPVTLDYNADCATGAGWHYDDPTLPTRIVLCQQSCNAVLEGAADSKVQIQFGCATKGAAPK